MIDTTMDRERERDGGGQPGTAVRHIMGFKLLRCAVSKRERERLMILI